MDEGPRHPWALGLGLLGVTAVVAIALLLSEGSGTGATNVGESGPERTATPEPRRAGARSAPRRCEATRSNPGGTNNYIPDAPPADSLGSGFAITGLVSAADGCKPLEDVRIQVWLATETGGEQDNRASVRTGADGRYRIETAPTVAQFGEPNIHVGYDDREYGEVFIRRVVDLDDALFVESPSDARFAMSPDGPTRARMALIATIALLGVFALGVARRRLPLRRGTWRILHAYLAGLVIALGLGHAVLTDGALDGLGTPLLLVLGAAGLLLIPYAHARR